MKKRTLKFVVFLVLLILLLGLSACGNVVSGGHAPAETTNTNDSGDEANKAPTPTNDSNDEIVQTPSSTDEMIGAGNLGDYYVEIKGGTLAEDYEGNLACVITYSWTNNSEETTSAMLSVSEKAFQDGVELDTALIMDSSIYDSGASMKDVRPGTTIDVQCAFVLNNQTSDVEVELSELFSFSKNSPKVVKVYTIN